MQVNYTMKVAFIFPPPWDPHYPPYSLALFKASTKKAGFEFVGFDLNNELYHQAVEGDGKYWSAQHAHLWHTENSNILKRYSQFLDMYVEKMVEKDVDIYAFSIITYSKYIALYLAQKVKEVKEHAKIIFGGPQCFPAYDGLKVLQNQCVDAICTGEGDIVWPLVLRHFKKNKNLEVKIPGIAYKKGDGIIVDNGPPELVSDLDLIPFADFSSIDFSKYTKKNIFNLSVMTSRGCINSCAFCSERPNFYKYRFRNAENIVDEITQHLNHFHTNPSISSIEQLNIKDGQSSQENPNSIVPYICFNDSLINGAPKELEKFCDLVIEKKLRFLWGGMALIRKEMTYELLVKMKAAGCYNLAWGMESGSQKVLNLMCKKFITLDIASKVIKLVDKVKIKQSINLIVGFPGETEEMFNETILFLREFKEYFFSVGVQPMMIPLNSAVSDRYREFGVKNLQDRLKWQTLDGENTYDVRLERIEILKSVLDERILTIDK
jgi:radical SAM superfamily enzyme YgiQ (UPF0313 family)